MQILCKLSTFELKIKPIKLLNETSKLGFLKFILSTESKIKRANTTEN